MVFLIVMNGDTSVCMSGDWFMRTHSSRDTGSMRAFSCQALAEGQIGGRIFDLSSDEGALVLIKLEGRHRSIPKRREKMVRSSSPEDGVTTFGWSIGCQLDCCRGSSGRQASRQEGHAKVEGRGQSWIQASGLKGGSNSLERPLRSSARER
jgi:hypothetical protein